MPSERIMSGIIRRMDDLGRIVVPKELRRKLGVGEDSPIEQVMTPDGLLLRPYYSHDDMSRLYGVILDLLEDNREQYPDKADYELLVALAKQSRQLIAKAKSELLAEKKEGIAGA